MMSDNGKMHVTRWWWVRHAPVIGDHGRIYGQQDLSCDCSDSVVFNGLVRALPGDAVWFASHLKRTHQTAAAIFAAGLPKPATLTHDVRFAEQDVGRWQGLSREEFFASRPKSLSSVWFGPVEERAPDGESFADLCARVHEAIGAINASHRGRDVVVVAHGGTIKAAISLALGLGLESGLSFAIENCSITQLDHRVEGDREGWRIRMVNHQPWIVPSEHESMDRPDGPEIKLA
jgi:broad specificity phosphatase PhoE